MIRFIAHLLVLQALTAPSPRDAAVRALERIRGTTSTTEFQSLTQTLHTADQLAVSNPSEADAYFRLVVLKAEFLERAETGGSLLPAETPSSSHDGPEPVSPADIHHRQEPSGEPDAEQPPLSRGSLITAETVHTVARGETLPAIARRYGIALDVIARKNRVSATAPLKEGMRLRVQVRRIAPKVMSDGIVVNIPERTLYYFRKGSLTLTAPVSLGKPKNVTGEGWETPTGEFTILGRVKDPVWTIPRSIREEMALQGKSPQDQVPPGPANPLGKYALKTSIPRILIHGTNARNSIYRFSSHGCIRVPSEEMEKLYLMVPLRTPGEIVYSPVKVAATTDGRVFIEVHADAYGKVGDLEKDAQRIVSSYHLDASVDWEKVRKVLRRKSGIAEEVTRHQREHEEIARNQNHVGRRN